MGLGKNENINYMKSMCKTHRLDYLFLMETKVDGRRVENICITLKFPNFHIVKAIGMRGGMVFIWIDDLNIQCHQITKRILKCHVQ